MWLAKILYILFFAFINVFAYNLLHKVLLLNRTTIITIVIFLSIVILLYLSMFKIDNLISKYDFFGLLLMSVFPLCSFIWFRYFSLNKINNLKKKGINESFVNWAIKLFSFLFLKFMFVIVFVLQSSMIILYHT